MDLVPMYLFFEGLFYKRDLEFLGSLSVLIIEEHAASWLKLIKAEMISDD